MKNLILIAFVILISVCFGQTEMKIYKKNGQVESVPITQVDSVKYYTSSPTMMNVYKNNNTAILSVSINDIDSVKYLSNNTSSKIECDSTFIVNITSGLQGSLIAEEPIGIVDTVLIGFKKIGVISSDYKNFVISSIGVTGLSLSFFQEFSSNGNTYLLYSAKGTPKGFGSGSFEIDLGNNKSCSLNFKTTKKIEYVSDASGNVYSAVEIGDQVWLSRNLVTTKYRNYSGINNVTDNTEWGSNMNNSPSKYGAYVIYDNSYNNFKYGLLYNFQAAGGVCPTGWHLPSKDEWLVLINYLGGDNVAGGKLKEEGTTNWNSPNVATNSSFFSALPGGQRSGGGIFDGLGTNGTWWTSTTSNSGSQATVFSINNGSERITWYDSPIKKGHSVRCIKDK